MRHYILLILFLNFYSSKAFAQWNMSFDIGYGFNWASDDLPDGSIMELKNGARSIEIFKTSFGSGRNYSFTIDRRLSSYLTLECQFSYLEGSKSTRTLHYTTLEFSENYYGNMLWITPGLKIKPNINKRVLPYARLGFGVGAVGKIHQNQTLISSQGLLEITTLYSKGIAYAISSSFGFTYKISLKSKWEIFSEIRLRSASYAPKQSERIRDVENGVDQLPSLTTNSKFIIYEAKFVKDENQPIDLSKPTIALKRYYPFSSLGLNIGIAYTF